MQCSGTGNWAMYSGLVGDIWGSHAMESFLNGAQVAATAPTNSQVLTFNSTTGMWQPAASASPTYPTQVGTPLELTAQTASITTTAAYTALVTGTYRVSIIGYVQSAGSAGTCSLGIGWNDGSSSKSVSVGSGLTLSSSTSQATGTYTLHVASGQAINYYTTVSGATGSPQYGLDVVIERLQ
jgi:hypothetical protein